MEDGLSTDNVTCWEGRPRRVRKAQKRYWDEYVATDTWYQKKLTEDVPEDEWDAAVNDSDFENDSGEEGDSEEEAEGTESEDTFVEESSDDILSDDCYESESTGEESECSDAASDTEVSEEV